MGKAKSVQVLHSQLLTKRPTPDNAQLGILFENGAIANVFASFCVEDGQYYKNSLVLNFERGTVTRNMCAVTREQLARETTLSLVTLDSNKRQTVINTTIAGSTEQYQWDEFHRILTGKAEIPEAADRAMTEAIRIVNAMARAEQSGRMESVG
jgi:predicted dehydrogenase